MHAVVCPPLHREDQALFRPWHLLCSQLQNVVVEVLRYTSIDVLEPLWCDMYGRLVQAGNMDEVCVCVGGLPAGWAGWGACVMCVPGCAGSSDGWGSWQRGQGCWLGYNP